MGVAGVAAGVTAGSADAVAEIPVGPETGVPGVAGGFFAGDTSQDLPGLAFDDGPPTFEVGETPFHTMEPAAPSLMPPAMVRIAPRGRDSTRGVHSRRVKPRGEYRARETVAWIAEDSPPEPLRVSVWSLAPRVRSWSASDRSTFRVTSSSHQRFRVPKCQI